MIKPNKFIPTLFIIYSYDTSYVFISLNSILYIGNDKINKNRHQ